MKTVKFYTLGCKVNQYDTQSIRERFLSCGFKELEDGQAADIYVINTCTVTANADRESKIIIRNCSKISPQAKIIVTGCLVEKDALDLADLKGISFIISKKFFSEGISNFFGHTRAFLKIQDGCNNFCSYCKVSLARGPSRSRLLSEIIQEAGQLVKNGYKEIVLSGICLGSYGKDLEPRLSLVDVIDALENIEGLLRIRLSSIEAVDISDELIHKMTESLPGRQAGKKLCRHLHIPIQSGDDEILKKMNRKYCRDDYLNLIKKIKSNIPEIAITTDVLLGFPGESKINFKNTVDLIKEILPLKVHIFPYSPREGTSAFNFEDRVHPTIIKERIMHLKNIAWECALIYKKQFLNKNMDVLFEAHLKENPQLWQGYTDNYLKVRVKSKAVLKNRLISLELKKLNDDYLDGDFC